MSPSAPFNNCLLREWLTQRLLLLLTVVWWGLCVGDEVQTGSCQES